MSASYNIIVAAPKFNRNRKFLGNWAKAVKRVATEGELSETKILQFEFCSKFREFVQEKGGNIKLRKAYPQHWYDISFGFSTAHIAVTVNSQLKQIACEVYIPDSKQLFLDLSENKDEKVVDADFEEVDEDKDKKE